VQFQIGAVLQHSNTPARNASRSDAGGPSLRVAGFEDEHDDEDSGSTELAEVLPDEALRSVVGSSVPERSRENEAPHENLRGNPLFLICFEGVDRTTAGGYRSYTK
jgi:hypothetical protein